jgi:glycine dehydrogenase subunit 2
MADEIKRDSEAKNTYKLPKLDVEPVNLSKFMPANVLREEFSINPIPEPLLLRKFTRLSQMNYSIDTTMVPLGSCTMKYNPRINEEIASEEAFTGVHPLTPDRFIQGTLRVAYELKELLKELGGFAEVCLQPAAGSQGELLGLLLILAYHRDRGNHSKRTILIPDSAHGTNPASAALCGFEVRTVKSNSKGELDWEDFLKKLDEKVAGLMITNPNTLGIFERKIKEIATKLHEMDALLYMDGANFNALVGKAKPGEWGVDIMHYNLHKTFSTPHGGGGPGSGPIGVSEKLLPYLPVPQVDYDGERYFLNYNIPKSVGRLLAFHGHFGVWIRALAYILTYGKEIKRVAQFAVLNARFLRKLLEGVLHDPYSEIPCMHEFVLSCTPLLKKGVNAYSVAKRLLDYGFYAPTVYFPLVVKEALMIEPTETESPETLRKFAQAIKNIVKEAHENPQKVNGAPYRTPVRRILEADANRKPVLRYNRGAKPPED